MRKAIAFSVAATIPLLFTITWLITNKVLPVADAANYLATGVVIYQKFNHHGFIHDMHSIFFTRGWRPIAFPIITLPFFIITKGDLFATYCSSACCIVILSIIYVYLFLRLLLDRVAAALSTALICLLPAVQMVALNFFAESLLLPFTIGAIYHLIKSASLTDKKHTTLFAICIICAALVRPVEATASLLLPMAWYVFSTYKQMNSDFKKEIKISLLILLSITIWYLPFYKETYEWIYRTSFGDVAAADTRVHALVLENIESQILIQGLIPTVIVAFLALLNSMLNRFRNIWQKEFTYLLLLSPISIGEVLFTMQNQARKFAISYTAFFMVALMIGLKKGIAWHVRIGIIALLLLFQFSLAMFTATNHTNSNFIFRYGMAGINKPINIKFDPYAEISNFLIQEFNNYQFKRVSLLIETEANELIDPFVFETIILAKKPGFHTPIVFSATVDEKILDINKADAVFISDHADKLAVSITAADYYQHQFNHETSIGKKAKNYFLFHYAANDLNKLGWKVGRCIDLVSLSNNAYKGCLLIKN